ncbi:unnamed protein product [Closterium sp. NIES-65]|nr:unnamed protein product [Closterium sp. NIES-65]
MTSSQVSAAFAAARTSKVTTIVWFRRDLRVEDNPALIAAAQQGAVVPLFVWSPEEEGQFFPGRVSRWWLRNSLSQLHAALTALGVPLFMRRAKSTLAVLLEVMAATGATQVFYNHLYGALPSAHRPSLFPCMGFSNLALSFSSLHYPASLVRDHRVKQELSRRGVVVRSFNADLLFEPWEIFDDHGKAFTTFRSFWRHCLHHPRPSRPDPPLPAPARLCGPLGFVRSVAVDLLGLEADDERPSNDLLARAWLPGCTNADRALVAFLHGPLLEYAANRSKADSATTSLLSPHLHFGEISARRIFHECQRLSVAWQKDGLPRAAESVAQFVRALGFREYSRYLSFNFPFTHERSLLANLKHFPWRVDEHMFKLWRQGRTGYPLVDAGMRELWATGWLHNRIRVVVASFCVKFLQLPWRWGMKYFWDTLLDADLEADVLGWQYISGSLPDGHELDRMDDPEEDGYRFDPEGEYVRRWVPELARVPTDWIHHPWDAPPVVLRMAGVELGANYPRPVLDVLTARQRLQEAVDTMWQREAALKAAAANGCDEGLGDTEEVLVAFSRAPDHRLPMRVHTALVRPELSCANGASAPAASHSTLVASARGGGGGLARSASCDSAAASGVGPWRGPADNGEGEAQGVRAGGEELPLAVQMEAAAAAVMAADRAGKAARGPAEGECGEAKKQVADGEPAELAAGRADGADGGAGAGGVAPGVVPWNDQMVPYFPSPATIQAAEAILAGDAAAAAHAMQAEGVQPPFPKDAPAEEKGTRPPAPGAPEQPAAGKGNVAGGATSALPRWAAVLGGQGGAAGHGTVEGLSPSARVSSLVELQLFPSAPRPAPADGARAPKGKVAEGSKKDGGGTPGKEGGGVLGKRGFSNVWGDDTPFPSTMFRRVKDETPFVPVLVQQQLRQYQQQQQQRQAQEGQEQHLAAMRAGVTAEVGQKLMALQQQQQRLAAGNATNARDRCNAPNDPAGATRAAPGAAVADAAAPGAAEQQRGGAGREAGGAGALYAGPTGRVALTGLPFRVSAMAEAGATSTGGAGGDGRIPHAHTHAHAQGQAQAHVQAHAQAQAQAEVEAQAQAEIEAQIEAQLGGHAAAAAAAAAAAGRAQQRGLRSPQRSKPERLSSEDAAAAAMGKKGWGPLTFLSLVSPHLPHHQHHPADPHALPTFPPAAALQEGVVPRQHIRLFPS